MITPTTFAKSDKILCLDYIVHPLLNVGSSRGVNPHKLLRGTGVFEADLGQQKQVSCLQLERLLGNAAQAIPGYDGSFQIGRGMALDGENPVFKALKYSKTLEQGLLILQCYQSLWTPLISCRIFDDEGQYIAVFQDAIGTNRGFHYALEVSLTCLVAVIKQTLGKRAKFRFEFTQNRPRHIHEYEENLGHRIQFGRAQNRLIIDKAALFQESMSPSPYMMRYALNQCRQMGRKSSFPDYVRDHICRNPAVTLGEIAQSLNMSAATLKRKLNEHHYRFRDLADEVGRQKAYYFLGVKQYNNEKSAFSMAFSDINNFRRSVKRWTGLTPSELREMYG